MFDFEDILGESFNPIPKNLLVQGENCYGQLLVNDKATTSTPSLVDLPTLAASPIDQISSGSSHTFFKQGSLIFCCGSNYFGQLGIGEEKQQSDFEIIDFFNKGSEVVTLIVCRYNQTFFLTDQGRVYCCGFNEEGCLGVAPSSNIFGITEVKIPGGKAIQKISIGMYHVLMLTVDGELMVSGLQSQGQLFLDTKNRNQKSITMNRDMSGKHLQDVGCGQYYSIALSQDLKLWVSGVLNGGNSPSFLEYNLNKEFGFAIDNTMPLSLICSATCCDDWFLIRVFCEFNLYLDKEFYFKWNEGKVRDVTNDFNIKINEEVLRTTSGRKVMALVTKSGKLFYLTNSDREVVDQSTSPSLYFLSVSHPFHMESFPDAGLLAIVGNITTSF